MGAVFRLGYAEVSLFETHGPGFSDGKGAGRRPSAKLPHPAYKGNRPQANSGQLSPTSYSILETHCHNGGGVDNQRQHHDDAHATSEHLLGALRRFATFLLLQLALSSSLNLCGLLLGRKLLTHSLIPQLSANLHAALASLGGIDEHFPLIAAHVPLASALVNWLAADHGEHDVSRSAAFNDRRNGVDKRSLTRTRQIA